MPAQGKDQGLCLAALYHLYLVNAQRQPSRPNEFQFVSAIRWDHKCSTPFSIERRRYRCTECPVEI